MAAETIEVPEIHCDHCKTSIEGALRGLPGVAQATVDVPSRTVSVEYGDPATREGIVRAIEDVGFEVPA